MGPTKPIRRRQNSDGPNTKTAGDYILQFSKCYENTNSIDSYDYDYETYGRPVAV
jgi:hypothetical protein